MHQWCREGGPSRGSHALQPSKHRSPLSQIQQPHHPAPVFVPLEPNPGIPRARHHMPFFRVCDSSETLDTTEFQRENSRSWVKNRAINKREPLGLDIVPASNAGSATKQTADTEAQMEAQRHFLLTALPGGRPDSNGEAQHPRLTPRVMTPHMEANLHESLDNKTGPLGYTGHV